jgi:hypothetical protein
MNANARSLNPQTLSRALSRALSNTIAVQDVPSTKLATKMPIRQRTPEPTAPQIPGGSAGAARARRWIAAALPSARGGPGLRTADYQSGRRVIRTNRKMTNFEPQNLEVPRERAQAVRARSRPPSPRRLAKSSHGSFGNVVTTRTSSANSGYRYAISGRSQRSRKWPEPEFRPTLRRHPSPLRRFRPCNCAHGPPTHALQAWPRATCHTFATLRVHARFRTRNLHSS